VVETTGGLPSEFLALRSLRLPDCRFREARGLFLLLDKFRGEYGAGEDEDSVVVVVVEELLGLSPSSACSFL